MVRPAVRPTAGACEPVERSGVGFFDNERPKVGSSFFHHLDLSDNVNKIVQTQRSAMSSASKLAEVDRRGVLYPTV
jgi:hypothetical protein